MAVNKNFVVKNGLEVGDNLIYAVDANSTVGIASTVPSATLGVNGGIAAVDGKFVGIVTTQSRLEVGVGGTTLSADSDNGRIGINSATPTHQLEIVGSGGTSLFIHNGSINATAAKLSANVAINTTGINVTGVTTSTSFSGSGSGLTGVSTNFVSAVGIQSAGTVIGVGITQLNFIGLGNTFKTNGTTVDISIEGGGGGGVGTAIDYPSGLRSPFSYIDPLVTVTESLTFSDVNAGLSSSYIVVKEPTMVLDPGITLTVGAGKTLVTDLFRLLEPPSVDLNPNFSQLHVSGLSTFVGVGTFNSDLYVQNNLYVGAAVTINASGIDAGAGIISATSFTGDGSNLTNTGATLGAASGSQRIVVTSLTSGTMTSAATEAALTYDASSDTITAGIFSGSGASLTSITNSNLSGSAGITNANLANSTISGISLGGTLGTLTMAVSGTGLSGSDTYDGSGSTTFTVTSNATDSNTASTLVARNASGDFSAGTITASLSGTASLATQFTVTANNTTNETVYPVFVDGATGSQGAETDTALSYNPSSNTLTASTFSGSLSGNADTATTATNATNITLADESSDTTCFPVFALTATGNQPPKTDSSALTYNASTGTLAATNVNSTSDINLKTDIHDVEDAITIINQIRGVKFRWRELDIPSVGVIAQEVEAVLPELISTRSDDGTKSVNYNGLVGVLIEAVKELSTRVEHLESQLNNK